MTAHRGAIDARGSFCFRVATEGRECLLVHQLHGRARNCFRFLRIPLELLRMNPAVNGKYQLDINERLTPKHASGVSTVSLSEV